MVEFAMIIFYKILCWI